MRWHAKIYFGTFTIFGRISRFSEKFPCRGITLSFSDGNFPQQRRVHFKCCCEYNGGIVVVFSWSVEIGNQWVWTLDKWNCTKWSYPMAFIFPSSFVFPSFKRTPRFFGLQPYMFSYSHHWQMPQRIPPQPNPPPRFSHFSIFAEGQRTFGIFHLSSHSAQQSVAIPGFIWTISDFLWQS